MSARRATIIAEAVAVACPHCGEYQPAPGGSEFVTIEELERMTGRRHCVSCDKPMQIGAHSRAVIRY